ncbi:uncharacterized protein GGS22DRAFT_174029 [Annulohypoxylon maeteangense]|uniref:uncharacterized protein n=1 Tax=Annulohypoxylon maeteangense TaxID=1927788 RepID=UPI00200807C9|nr:uncharacterized protein GGS22DRAFT_174029 [Annulohypoxylon maeteangense]KAI0881009.1 hypothetical protein GGS22DRAFT_174029 [Annulohypoxylon maeteangense]
MAKNKKRGGGPKLKSQRFPRRNHSGEYGGTNLPSTSQGFVRAHGYTLADEARNTASNRRGAFGRDAKLRYKPVTFISAGLMDPLKELNVQLAATDEAQKDTSDTGGSLGTDVVLTVDSHIFKGHVPSSSPDEEPSPHNQFSNDTGLSLDPESDISCDSSEEIILFRGRDHNRNRQNGAAANSLELRDLNLELQAVEETLHEDTTQSPNTKRVITKAEDFIPLRSKPKRRDRRREKDPDASSDDVAAILADYMSNVEGWGGRSDNEDVGHRGIGSHSFSVLRELGGTDSDAVPDEVSSKDGVPHSSEDEIDVENQQICLETEDERIARLLSKQEELGLGGNDVLLFDGEASDDEWLAPTKANLRRKKKGDTKSAKIFHKKGQYPSATQMAEAFDELDLMDWHRPSLKNFEKGSPTFDVSDSELNEAMKATWQKDRLKKAEKKKAREELRSQGLLGKNTNPDDLRVKYVGGMSLDDLADELESFLLGSQEQLILPPFEKTTRKTIHTVANKFKIKSQSAGKGNDRCPVLYRSKATLPFDQDTFDKTFGRIKQTWFPRVDADEKLVNESRLLKRSEVRNGKTRFKNSLTYRDGDIVGQHAVELGVENRGRAMLEKMGWSKGMALGTGENKGIMVPITHVVKKTKAGLGDT